MAKSQEALGKRLVVSFIYTGGDSFRLRMRCLLAALRKSQEFLNFLSNPTQKGTPSDCDLDRAYDVPSASHHRLNWAEKSEADRRDIVGGRDRYRIGASSRLEEG
jgi:hypothetical protein